MALPISILQRGTRAAQPAATSVAEGVTYCVEDENFIVEQSDGAAWQPYSATGAGTGDVNGPAASVDKELALFDGTTGKLLERATGTGFVKVTSGVMGVPSATVALASEVSGTLPIANGGTANTTATAAFDALAPTTTAGDIIQHNGTDNVRLGIGTAGQVLTVNAGATAVEYQTPSGGGTVVQVVNTQTGAVNSTSATIPPDDTIPQSGEGAEFMTLAITPTNAANKLKIEVSWSGSGSTADSTTIVALFQDATADALAAAWMSQDTTTGPTQINFSHYMTAGTTSATTFKVRAGLAAAGTLTFNGQSATRRLGGVLASGITISEIVP